MMMTMKKTKEEMQKMLGERGTLFLDVLGGDQDIKG
jgi:hypothetical protein